MTLDQNVLHQMEMQKLRRIFERKNEVILAKCGKAAVGPDEIEAVDKEFRRAVRAECNKHTVPVMGGFCLRCFECPNRPDGGVKMIDGSSPCSHIGDWVKAARAYYSSMIALQAAKTELNDVERAITENEERILKGLKARRKTAKTEVDLQDKNVQESKLAFEEVDASF